VYNIVALVTLPFFKNMFVYTTEEWKSMSEKLANANSEKCKAEVSIKKTI
jgi:DNA-binding transcriptional regulator/RsmH inhibitor MraZ